MVVLALETVTRAGSVAVAIDDACDAVMGESDRTHAERLPGELLACLARNGRQLRDVDHFAVITGPGSFTGLRVGIAAIQGLAIASGRTVVPLPTLEAMALGWIGHTTHAAGSVVVSCLDGHRGEVFAAAWRLTAAPLLVDADMVLSARVGLPDAVADDLKVALGQARLVLVGGGARRHATVFGRLGEIVDVPVPLAEVAARYAARHPELSVTPHALQPIYIRRPDAVLARERAGQPAHQPRS